MTNSALSDSPRAGIKWWLWLNLLSLDAPIVAILWQSALAHCYRVNLLPGAQITLFLAVWLIYMVDRVLDSYAPVSADRMSARHAFYRLVRGNAQALTDAVQKIGNAITAPLSVNGYEFSLTTSIGSASYPRDGDQPEALLREADAQRHRAKRQVHGAPTLRRQRVGGDALGEILTEHELRQAIENGELLVHYQPIVRLGTPVLAGAEALIRWRHPQRGLLAPASFLGVAEEAGLTREISRTVLSQVTRDLASAPALFAPDFRVNINLCALDFRDLKLFKELGALLREAGMAPQRYRFEVTEGMLMEDVGTAERVVGLLADYGVEFAIDDFGTGYSSLAQLSRLPVHELKIDHTFTQSIDTKRGKTVVRAVLDLAARLEMPVTAEGIETRTQALALTAYGCDKAQGYLYGRAMPFTALLDFARGAGNEPARVP